MKTTNTSRPARFVAAVFTSHATISRRVAPAMFATASALALLVPLVGEAGAEPASSGFVYTADEHGNSVSRIDLASGKVATLPGVLSYPNRPCPFGSGPPTSRIA